MPNHSCERCTIRKCRVLCSKCSKPVCEDCRIIIRTHYICNVCYNRRIIPIRESFTVIKRDDRVWGSFLQKQFNLLNFPQGLTPRSASIKEYTARYPGFLDRYTRIGKYYTLMHSISSDGMRVRHYEKLLKVSDEFKEELAAKSMHPDRLQYWMNQGWEDYWDDYF